MKSYKERMNEKCRSDPYLRHLSGEELEKLKYTLLRIYLDIQAVCDKYGLICMLLGGSALGAVRHRGFIPWDDDLDLGMPRDDYEIFKQIFKAELGEKYVLNAPNYEGMPTNRFPKVLKKGTRFVEAGMREDDERACIKVDIFILDNVPDNLIERTIKGLFCTVLMFIGGHVLTYECYKSQEKRVKMSKRQFIGMLFSFNSSEVWFNRIDNACIFREENTYYVGVPAGRKHYFGEILPRAAFFPVSKGFFEGHKVNLPRDVDAYLKNLYGDYMKIPPEEKREHHYIEKIVFNSQQEY